MKKGIFSILLLSLIFLHSRACADFTSLRIFGDSISTTTNNVAVSTNYFGNSYCNGPVWVQFLAQQQGITYVSNYNNSFFGNSVGTVLTVVSNYLAPTDAGTALFVVWVNAGDMFINWLYYNTDNPSWVTAFNVGNTNYLKILQNLYDKGARTFVLPNAVNIGAAPLFALLPTESRDFLRQKAIEFNAGFSATLAQARTNLPGANIYAPDLFTQFEMLRTNPAAYGLVNPGTDAMEDGVITDKSTNGPGANYVFWDSLHPTSKVHGLMADLIEQLISPTKINGPLITASSNRLDFVNLPLGKIINVESSTNLTLWTTNATFAVSNKVQSVFVPAIGTPHRFFRLHF